jgi:hypothetical protein
LSGLFDFFQSASNTVADNVAGPVDLINAGLGLFGLRSKEPVGGSEWMKRWGLKRDVEMGGARLAGETAGLLSPTLLAAKAPQIAKGLLQAQENAAIPRQMHPEMGAIVYHGSPHKFDKFDSSKIGTGEGAQAYGHGLYLAESPEVAKSYAVSLSNPAEWKYSTKTLPDGSKSYEVGNLVTGEVKAFKDMDSRASWMAKLSEGNNYKVDLPDTAIAKMLDWDKPLSQQAPEVQKALEKHPQFANFKKYDHSGSTIYDRLRGDNANYDPLAANNFLKPQGIPGIRYLDGGSRNVSGRFVAKHPQGGENVFNSAGELDAFIKRNPEFKPIYPQQTSNYVVFPGEEHLLKILERNGGLMGP